ncbi:MAG: type II toxin-antitoxin system RelE/ParE family toxin [archaeon]
MMYVIEFSKEFEKAMRKLKKKSPVLHEQIKKKLVELITHPDHYTPLSNVLSGFQRIHFGSHVLIFRVEKDIVRIITLDHHNNAYKE